MPTNEPASLTKEFPIDEFDRTILAIRPGMSLEQLRAHAAVHTKSAIPGLLAKRYLLVMKGAIRFDRLLLEIQAERGITGRIRKAMFFVWCWRDERLRSFICDRVADANGHWRAAVLLDKGQASFFRQIGANKARSNLEEYLAKGGMLDRASKRVHMRLDDGWLPLAIEVAAQHESDPQTRSRLLADPAEFLVGNSLYPLASASEAEVRKALSGLPPPDPLQDQVLSAALAGTPSQARAWTGRTVRRKTAATTTIVRDEVKFERASRSHQELERL